MQIPKLRIRELSTIAESDNRVIHRAIPEFPDSSPILQSPNFAMYPQGCLPSRFNRQ